MSVNRIVSRTRSPTPIGVAQVRSPSQSSAIDGSSPIVQASCPAGMSKTSFGPNSVVVPSGRRRPQRPDSWNPTWRDMHHSVPTSGFTCVDQRQPGSQTSYPTVRSPTDTDVMCPWSNSMRSSGWSRFLRRTSGTLTPPFVSRPCPATAMPAEAERTPAAARSRPTGCPILGIARRYVPAPRARPFRAGPGHAGWGRASRAHQAAAAARRVRPQWMHAWSFDDPLASGRRGPTESRARGRYTLRVPRRRRGSTRHG